MIYLNNWPFNFKYELIIINLSFTLLIFFAIVVTDPPTIIYVGRDKHESELL